jgi:uncharacterized Zn-finger protein
VDNPKPDVIFICDHCGAEIRNNKWNVVRHMENKHLQKRIPCLWNLCVETFSGVEARTQHMVKFHDQETPHVCLQCDKKFAFKSQLRQHNEQIHHIVSGEVKVQRTICKKAKKSETCEYCSKTFSVNNIKRHVKIVHMGERPFPCPWDGCSSAFGQKVQLQVHIRQHTGEKPNCCTQCEFRCADPSTLFKHLKNVHKIEPKKKKN